MSLEQDPDEAKRAEAEAEREAAARDGSTPRKKSSKRKASEMEKGVAPSTLAAVGGKARDRDRSTTPSRDEASARHDDELPGEDNEAVPDFADLAVEAVHNLASARGSSLSAMVAWARSSPYAPALEADEADDDDDITLEDKIAIGVEEVRQLSLLVYSPSLHPRPGEKASLRNLEPIHANRVSCSCSPHGIFYASD